MIGTGWTNVEQQTDCQAILPSRIVQTKESRRIGPLDFDNCGVTELTGSSSPQRAEWMQCSPALVVS